MGAPCRGTPNCSCYCLMVSSSKDVFGVVPATLVVVMATAVGLLEDSADLSTFRVRETVDGLIPSRLTVDLLNVHVTSVGRFEQASCTGFVKPPCGTRSRVMLPD